LVQSVDGCVVRIRFEEDNLLGFRSGTFIQGSEGEFLLLNHSLNAASISMGALYLQALLKPRLMLVIHSVKLNRYLCLSNKGPRKLI
jgi:hypothetical protein